MVFLPSEVYDCIAPNEALYPTHAEHLLATARPENEKDSVLPGIQGVIIK